MSENKMEVKYLKDYKKPDYKIETVYLTITLDDKRTHVKSELKMKRNSDDKNAPIHLDALELEFISVKMNGEQLSDSQYELTDESLKILEGKDEFTLEIENYINPKDNKALEGLYKSGDMYCTQNEAEGFRRITYYIDRPDAMAKFTTKIIADKKTNPILLSNGNLIESGDLENGQHFATWYDPFNKPAYLYALVAGDLGMIKDEFTTMTGRKIDLRIYCDKGNEDKCYFAMESLKKAMKWDEDTYGLEYDLDIFMIVAVDAFNMGAMENKGLNIFNSSLVLADQNTATDLGFQRIEGVVGHEYFHNYTGNRITCRDWFQLTLKEGLTVFRDQEFSSDMNSRSVERIQVVEGLRELQFTEDAGPTQHPIKPDSYIEINNFYTPTVYEKGAEVIRMIHTFLGAEGFRKGMDKYFELYDGQAVTTNDFIYAMSVANDNFDFTQFEKTWYKKAGTPKLEIESEYDESKKTYTIKIKQLVDDNEPFHMPYRIGLVDKNGNDMDTGRDYLELKEVESEFSFENIAEKPYLSLNRDFSAPVNTLYNYDNDEAINLFKFDKNSFSRYEVGRKLASNIVKEFVKNNQYEIPEEYITAWGEVLKDTSIDHATKALLISLPSETFVHQDFDVIPYVEIHQGIETLRKKLAETYQEELLKIFKEMKSDEAYKFIPEQVGRRDLSSETLSYLMCLGNSKINQICVEELKTASNLTEEFAAFYLLAHSEAEEKEEAIKHFYDKWKNETLVLQKWMAAISSSPSKDTFDRVDKIIKSDDFDITVPNIVRSVLRTFGRTPVLFHDPEGRGYKLMADTILELDPLNPSMASVLSKLFMDFKRVPAENRVVMGRELYRIQKTENLSKNTFEIINKILA